MKWWSFLGEGEEEEERGLGLNMRVGMALVVGNCRGEILIVEIMDAECFSWTIQYLLWLQCWNGLCLITHLGFHSHTRKS